MDIANWLVKLYLSEHFLQTAFISIVFSASIAHFADRAMGKSSFGLLVNTAVVLAAIVIGVDDLELLEAFEDARDTAEFRAAQIADDGGRISLADLRDELGE